MLEALAAADGVKRYRRFRLTPSWATENRTRLSSRSTSAGSSFCLALQRFLGALHGFFRGVLVDLGFVDRKFGEHLDAVALDLGKAAADHQLFVSAPLVTRSSPSATWVSSGIWPGRMPISPSTVGMTTVSTVSL